MLGVTGCLPASKTRARPTVSARASNCSISKISTVSELWPWWYISMNTVSQVTACMQYISGTCRHLCAWWVASFTASFDAPRTKSNQELFKESRTRLIFQGLITVDEVSWAETKKGLPRIWRKDMYHPSPPLLTLPRREGRTRLDWCLIAACFVSEKRITSCVVGDTCTRTLV